MKKQMEKMLSVLLMLSLLAIIAIPVMAKDDDVWTLDQSVDDFGDANGDYIIKTVVDGTFSNTATTDSDLKVFVYFLLDDKGVFGRKGAYILAFRLLEARSKNLLPNHRLILPLFQEDANANKIHRREKLLFQEGVSIKEKFVYKR